MDPLTEYTKLRTSEDALRKKLEAEEVELEARLAKIREALGRPTRAPTLRPKGALSMRETIIKALTERGPMTRKELGKAVLEMGYQTAAKDPLNSMGVVLYAKDAPFLNKDGKFYMPKK